MAEISIPNSGAGVAPAAMQVPWQSGRYYFAPPSGGPSSSAFSKENERACSFFVPNGLTLVRIGCQVTSAGDVGSKIRLGLRNDDGTGRPGTLLLDAGVIAGDSVTTQEITISVALFANSQYWITATSQVITTTAPTVVTATGLTTTFDQGATTPGTVNQGTVSRFMSSVTGALPGTWTDAGLTTAIPRFFVKVA